MKHFIKPIFTLIFFLFLVTGIFTSAHGQDPQTKKEIKYAKKYKIQSTLAVKYGYTFDKVNNKPASIIKDYYNQNGIKDITIVFNVDDSLPKNLILYKYDKKWCIKYILNGQINRSNYSANPNLNTDTTWKVISFICDLNGAVIEKKVQLNIKTESPISKALNSFNVFGNNTFLYVFKNDAMGNHMEEIDYKFNPPNPFKKEKELTKIKDGNKLTYSYEYKEGELISMKKNIENNWTETFEFKYDSFSNITQEFNYHIHNQYFSSWLTNYNYQYNSSGLILETQQINSSGTHSFKSCYDYQDNDSVVVKTYTAKINGRDSLLYKTKSKYNNYDSLRITNQKKPDTWVKAETKDSLNRVVKEILYSEKGRIEYKKVYKYYQDNKIKEIITFSSSDDVGSRWLTKFQYEFYDKK
jgi:hypothetical protein